MSETYADAGVFNIDGQWATEIRFRRTMVDGKIDRVTLDFYNGKTKLKSFSKITRQQALALIGAENLKKVESAETGKANMGRIQGMSLAFFEGREADLDGNTVEKGQSLARKRVNHLRVQVAAERVAQEERVIEQGLEAIQTEAAQEHEEAGPHDPQAVPNSVTKVFLHTGNKFYFPDETLAIIDNKDKLHAAVEHNEVVKAIVDMAYARGWETVVAKGSHDFRRAVWEVATLRGLEVEGYKPTELDQARIANIKARRTQGMENVAERGKDREHSTDVNEHRGAGKTQEGRGKKQAATAPTKQDAEEGLIKGILLAHGEDFYQGDKINNKSYYLKIKEDSGQERTVWGVDFPRALEESGAQVGERVTLQYAGKKNVVVKENVTNEKGQVVGTQAVTTHRNTWNIGRAEAFLSEERNQVIEKHPDLTGAYGTLAAARKFAQEKIASKADQDRFFNAVEKAVADMISHGVPVPAPKVKETRQKEQPKREQEPQSPRRAGRDKERHDAELTR